jgi:hypothetical protein
MRNTSAMAAHTNHVTRAASDMGRLALARRLLFIWGIQRIPHTADGLNELGFEVVVDFGP